ncbi:hypothetical protein HK098_007637 [Nowakowskiella sp. JEL0407]|nr:hypothetical protein HK098_007637 [Nowakowskiella sp. JEL0407]
MSSRDIENGISLSPLGNAPPNLIPHEKTTENAGPIPELKANFLSLITYNWMSGLFWKGYRTPITEKDLWVLGPRHDPLALMERFEVLWEEELKNAKAREEAEKIEMEKEQLLGGTEPVSKKSKKPAKKKNTGPRLMSVLLKQYGAWLGPIGFIKVISDVAQVFSPFLLKAIVTYVATGRKEPQPIGTGLGLIFGMFGLQLISTLTLTWYFHVGQSGAISIRTLITAAIYRKALKLSGAARQDFNIGKVMNVVSSDASRIEQFLGIIHLVWTAPLQLIVICAFLISQLGVAAVVGIALLLLFTPVQGILFRSLLAVRKLIAPITDGRVKQTNEVLQGIRIIKYFTWENSFLERIEGTRQKEIKQVLKRGYLSAFVMAIAFGIPAMVSSVAFIVYIVLTPNPDPATIFASLAWFNLLRFPLMLLPQVVGGWAEFSVALDRISSLLTAPEVSDPPIFDKNSPYAIHIENGTFKWELPPPQPNDPLGPADKKSKKKNQKKPEEPPKVDKEEVLEEKEVKPTLRNLNLQIPRGALVAVVGSVGSGKSSFLNALIGELQKVDGKVTIGGTIGYAAQQAWIQNASLEKNITFGLPFEKEKYDLAVKSSCLEADLRILPDGDQTEIGERGINISGGQKQRVNLARTVYFGSEIVLLDDPLSAVDSHVGKRLFQDCIKGALAGKTRVLVTHQLHFIPEVDYVVVFKDGEITEQGKYVDLMANEGAFSKLMKEYGGVDESSEEEGDSGSDTIDQNALVIVEEGGKKVEKKENKKAAELMQAEERAVGAVAGKIWWTYGLAAGGGSFFLTLGLLLVLMQGARVVTDFWLATWTDLRIPGFPLGGYAGVYMALGIAQAIGTFLVGVFLAYSGTRAAISLHAKALSTVIRAPVSFFDTTPLGRIINRFSKDQDAIDTTLMETFRIFLFTFTNAISTFITIIYVTPWFALPMAPLLVLYWFLQQIYRSVARELKRLDSLTRSPLYAFFGESFTGLSTIRAFAEQERFIKINEDNLRENIKAYYLIFVAQRWITVRLEFIGGLLVFAAGLFGILARDYILPSYLGLSLSYALQVTQMLNFCIRQFGETEVAMNAVERMEYYGTSIQREASPDTPPDLKPKAVVNKTVWPATGRIEIENLKLRYAPELPLVLKGLTFTVKDGEKIGIVGRTGSGKSTIMSALFRMVEPEAGSVILLEDENGAKVNTSMLGLDDLRRAFAIIPQDPVLFSGTIRSNLDPFNNYEDNDLWDALARANLKDKIKESPAGLSADVQEGGENFSVGQRQLLCLARAMLKKPRILIMDEATANVDLETDAIIQRALREDFKSATILTIAHRLNTIIDYDRVLVLSQGEIKEFDVPAVLLENRTGYFSAMVDETGPSNAELIRSLALKKQSELNGN